MYLLKNVDTEVVFKENKKAILNLNGHSITRSKETDVLFTNNGDLKIINGNISSNQMKANIILNNNRIELENVVVRSEKEIISEDNGAVFYNKGEAIINAEIYSNKENAILNENILNENILNITGGKVSSSYNVVILNNSGTLSITGGEFSSEQKGIITNLATTNITGGTFTSTQTGYYNLQNGTSSNNVASMVIDGATIDTVASTLVNHANLEIKSGNITSGSYSLYNDGGTSTISGGTLKGSGENVTVYNPNGTVNITGGEFSSEKSGIVTNFDKTNITGGTFTSTQTGYYNLKNGTSSNNAATMVIDGGVFNVAYNIVNYGDLEIKKGEITATRYALYNKSGTSAISGGTLKGTGTKTAIYNEKGTLNISGGDFSSEQRGIIFNLDKANITGGIFISTQTGYYNVQNGTSSNNVASMIIDGAVFDVEYNIVNYGDLEMKGGDINSTKYALYNKSGTSTISGGTIVVGDTNAIKNMANLIINGTSAITNNAASYPTIYNYAGSTITTDLTNAIITNKGGGETIYNAS